jgi:uncharacterized repeat protein (TIGR01451 family)
MHARTDSSRAGATGRRPAGSRWLLIAILLLGLAGLARDWAGPPGVAAANGLAVGNTVAEDPLVGSTVTYRISVRNDGSFPTVGTTNPDGRAYNLDIVNTLPAGVTFVSTTAPFSPAIRVLNPGSPVPQQRQELTFTNITDLVVNQTYSIDIVGRLNASIVPNTQLVNTAEARASSDARNPGTHVGTGYASGAVDNTSVALPFKLKKTTAQSTGVNQATGDCATNRAFGYTLTATNNGLGASSGLVITDTLPYGVEYCSTPAVSGVTAEPPVYNADGTTTLVYRIASLGVNGAVAISPKVAIPYTYATQHGAVPIAHDLAGAVIADGTTFTNRAAMAGTYAGQGYDTGTKTSNVTAKYATIEKAGSAAVVNQLDYIDYTLKVHTSVYYDATNVVVVDTIPNGQQYDSTLTPLAPASVVGPGPDGTTVVTWVIPAADTPANQDYTITFRVQVREDYASNSLPVVSGDAFTNRVGLTFDATSVAGLTPANAVTGRQDNASAGQGTNLPTFRKTVTGVTRADGTTVPPAAEGAVITDHKARAAVGDIVTFQIAFTAASGVDGKDIVLTDILPTNYRYVPGSSSFSGSYIAGGGRINRGAAEPECAASPCPAGALLIYRLTGNSSNNNIAPKGTTLTITLRAQVVAYSAADVDNLGKLSGSSTTGIAYSARDSVALTTLRPLLRVTKANNAGASVLGNTVVIYTVTVKNDGGTTAFQIADLVDTLPADLRYCDASVDATNCPNPPTISPAGAATFVGNSGTWGGTLTFAFSGPLAAGDSVTFTYKAKIEPAPVVGTDEINTARINSYASQPAGAPVSQTITTPAEGRSTVHIGGDILDKSATIVTPQVNADGRVTIGDVITYRITYNLPANTTVYRGEIRECMPLGFRYVAGSYSAAVTLGAFPNPGEVALTEGGSPGITVASGTNPCPADQEMIVIPIGTQDNSAGSGVTLQIELQGRVTGLNRANAAVFPNTSPVHSTRSDGTTANQNRVYLYTAPTATGTLGQVASKSIANNGTNNNVYVPHLTLALAVARPTTPTQFGGTTVIVPTNGTVDFLLTVTNDGGSTAYAVAPLLDTLGSGLEFVDAFASDATCQTTGSLGLTANGQQVPIPVAPAATPANSLAPGASYHVCLRARVVSTTPSTDLPNAVEFDPAATTAYSSAPAGTVAARAYALPTAAPVRVRTPDVITFPALLNQRYGDPPQTLGATSSGGRPIDYSITSGPCAIVAGQTPQVRITGAGDCTVRASQRGENLAEDKTQTFTIAKAPLTVRVNDAQREFGDTNVPCVQASTSPSGFVYSETVAVLGGALTCTTTARADSRLGTYPITPGGYTSPNYEITYLRATLTIVPKKVTMTLVTNNIVISRGQQATLTVTTSPQTAGGVAVRGYIQFWVDNRLLASVQVVNGTATYRFTPTLAPGTYKTEVRYLSPDSRFAPADPQFGTLKVN